MTNSDKYDKGWEQALKDAKAGKKRNKLNLKNFVKAIFAWDSNTYVDTYIQGYSEGYREYEKEQLKSNFRKEKNIKTNSNKPIINTKNRNIMSANQSLHLQLEQLEELHFFLNSFKDVIQAKMGNYQNKVDNIYSNGLASEVYNKFQTEHINETRALVSQIINLIDESSIPFVQQNIQQYNDILILNQ
jgi:hypothetical protein